MEATVITLKRRNILNVIEYCLDNKIEFTVKDKAFGNEEFDLKLSISDIRTALAFGYYARENRIEIPGVSETPKNTKSKTQARTNTANNLMTNKGQESSKNEEEDEIDEEENDHKIENEHTEKEITAEDITMVDKSNEVVFEEISAEAETSKSGLFGS